MTNKPPTERLELLLDRNAKLAAQLEVQRKHVVSLERRLEEQSKKEERWQETLLCVNRVWEELNSTIAFLGFRSGGADALGPTENAEAADASLLQYRNPFLAKLVQAFLPDSKQAKKLLEDDSSDDDDDDEEDQGGGQGWGVGGERLRTIEGGLRKRMAGTLEAAVQVMAAVEELRSRPCPPADVAPDAAAATSPPLSPQVGASGKGGGVGRGREGSSREAQMAAMTNLLKAENNRLRDQALKDGHKIRQLSNTLADREGELLVAKRKAAQLRESAAAALAGAGGSAGPAAGEVPGADIASPSGAPGGGGSRGGTPGPSPGTRVQQQQQQQQGGGGDGGAAELGRLRELVEKRGAELEAREETLMKVERELRDVRDRLASERDAAVRAKQYDQQRLALVNTELEKLAERSAQLHRDREHLVLRMHDLQYQSDKGLHALRQLAGAEAHIADLEARVATLRSTKAELEAQLLKERSRPSSSVALAEMKGVVEALQSDKTTLRDSLARVKGGQQGLEDAAQQAQQWRLQAEKAQAEVALIRAKLERQQLELASFQAKETGWKDREADLRLFVEVTHSFAGENRELEEVCAAEAKLREQVSALQSQLASHALQSKLDSMQSREADLVRQLEEVGVQRAQQGAEVQALARQVEDLKAQLTAVKAESDEYINEIEKVGEAYEEAQAQNTRLLAALGQREEEQAKLMAELAAAAQEKSNSKEDSGVAARAAARAEEEAAVLKQRIAELEGTLQSLMDELASSKAEARSLGARCDAAIQDLLSKDALLAAQRADLEAAQREAAERAVERDTQHAEHAKERQRAERLQEQLEEAQAKLERLRGGEGGGGGGMAERELQAECDALRKLINCNVCHQRQKDVVITKCWHLFCGECIRRNLETRHRKCPGCGTPFGQGDVKQFFFT